MKDPELELLNDLLKKYPADAADFMRPLPVTEAYASDPRTVCSVQTNWASKDSQSRLGFLNQSREVRGLSRIAAVVANGKVTEFVEWVNPEAAA